MLFQPHQPRKLTSGEVFLLRVYYNHEQRNKSIDNAFKLPEPYKTIACGMWLANLKLAQLGQPRFKKTLPKAFYYFPEKPLLCTSLLNNKRSFANGLAQC